MSKFYKRGPQEVPTDFTKAKPSFKKHVLLAMLALGSFVLVYSGLMVWFAYRAYTLFKGASNPGANSLYHVIAGICLGMLSIFMLKSLFIFRGKRQDDSRVLKQEEEPELFDYIYHLADEVGAPRPHKIILTPRVNASVFYDLSIFNLLIPSKKNLEIGLGLINVLSLGELKAVLAHEFGHFAQRSMLLGRYVYTAQQIAVRVVNKRDALDNIIRGLSSIDIRIAWIGWILSILVWAIRALIEVLFSVVVFAERALSREMEFQADKVAVSVTGSDALIHALHKLRAADEGYNAGLEAINHLLRKKQAAPDLFALQSNFIEKTRWILNDPDFGKSPVEISKDGKSRVFKNRIINPPEMWSTHPADLDREENAKEVYLYADIDERSAWCLFSNDEKLRHEVTANLIKTAGVETELISLEASIDSMNKEDFSWSFLDPRYQGCFLNRYAFCNFKSSDDLYENASALDIDSALSSMYPESLKDVLEKHKEILEEIQQLTVVQHEVLTAERRRIMHRGMEIKRRQIPAIIQELQGEEQKWRAELMAHDVLCRKVAYKIALEKSPETGVYLKSVSKLVHYSEHSIRDLQDLAYKFHNTLAVVTADGRVSDAEMIDLIRDSERMGNAMEAVFNKSTELKLAPAIEDKLGGSYAALFEPYKLGDPDRANINDWVNNSQSWFNLAMHCLHKLRNASLEHLLDTETLLIKAYKEKASLHALTDEVSGIGEYPLLMPGNEREIQYRLTFWDRFISGVGIVPTTAKFFASAGLVFIALWAANVDDGYSDDYYDDDSTELYVYNGFSIWVDVLVDGQKLVVPPHSYQTVLLTCGTYEITSLSNKGETIEKVNAYLTHSYSNYVYNVANSAYFIEYKVLYGTGNLQAPAPTLVGSPRIFESSAEYLFEEAPESIETYGRYNYGITTKTVLQSLVAYNPYEYPGIFEPDKDLKKLIVNHVKWEPGNDAFLIEWLTLSSLVDPSCKYAKERLEAYPDEVVSVRCLQDNLKGDEREAFLMKYRELAKNDPDNPDLYYLNARTEENDQKRDALILAGNQKWENNGWLSFAAAFVYANKGNWNRSLENFKVTMEKLPALRYSIMYDVERVSRMTGNRDNSVIDQNYPQWAKVNYLIELERGEHVAESELFENAYYSLSSGDLERTISYAHGFTDDLYLKFDWFVAASKGAETKFVQSVLNYDQETTVDANNAPVVLAVLAKNGRNYDALIQTWGSRIGFDEKKVQFLKDFVQAMKNGQTATATGILDKCDDFRQKMQLRLIGCIMTDGTCPPEWLSMTKKMTFITERPYLGD